MDKEGIKALENLKFESEIADKNPDMVRTKKSFENKVNPAEDETLEEYIQEYINEGIIEFDENQRIVFKDLEGAKDEVYGSVDEVYDAYREHYHLTDFRKVDLLLSTLLSVDSADKNIWLIYVGASGVGKSLMTNPIKYVEYPATENLAHLVSDLTTNTIVSGQGGQETDLAPKLDGKIMYVPDFSTVVGKRSEDQREIFSQLRNLYDGIAKKDTGSHGENPDYQVDVSFIGNVTPAIYKKNLIHQDMGTRFLYYQINDFQEREVMDKILEGSDKGEEEKSKEIAEVIEKFIYEADEREIETISDEVKQELKTIAKWTAKMRASGEFDRYNNELKGTITPEKPTRILKQFRKIYVNLKKLRKNYPDDRALSIIQKIGASNIDPDKRQIYIEIDTTEGLELTDLVDRMGIGRKAIKRRLLEMENVGIVKTEINYKADSDRLTYGAWSITEEFENLADEFTPE